MSKLESLRQELARQARSGRLVLGRDCLEEPSILELFKSVTGLEQLVLETPEIGDVATAAQRGGPEGGSLLSLPLSGKLSILNLARARAMGLFLEQGGLLVLRLELELQDGWRFSQSFPGWRPAPLAKRKGPALDDYVFTEARFFLASDSYEHEALRITVPRGLSFAGRGSSFSAASALVPMPDHALLSGPIVLDSLSVLSGGAQLRPWSVSLQTAVGQSWSPTPSISMELDVLELGCLAYQVPALGPETYTNEWSALLGRLRIGGADFDVSVIMPPEPKGSYRVSVMTEDGPRIPGLGALIELVGWDALKNSLPEALQADLPLALERFEFGFSPFSGSIDYFSIGVGTPAPWEMIPGTFRAEDIAISWFVLYPLDAKRRGLRLSIRGFVWIDDVCLQLVANLPGFDSSAQLVSGTIPVSDLAAKLIPGAAELPGINISRLSLFAAPSTGNYDLTVGLEDTWTLPLGISKLTISDVCFAIYHSAAQSKEASSTTRGQVSGVLSMAGSTFSVLYAVPGMLRIEGSIPSIDLSGMVDELCGDVFDWPQGFPKLKLVGTHVLIQKDQADYFLTAGTEVDGFGVFELEARKFKGKWGFAAGFLLPEAWSLSRLSPALEPFDVLKLSDAALVLASFDDPAFRFPTVALPGAALGGGVVQGANFYATLALSGEALELIGKLLSLEGLAVRAAIATDPAKTVLTGALAGGLELVPGIRFSQFNLTIRPQVPMAVELYSMTEVKLHGETLLFRLAQTVSPKVEKFSFGLDGEWRDPFGIRGLTVANVFLDLQILPTQAYGIVGEIAFDEQVRVRVGLQFAEGAVPDFFIGELAGSVSLAQVLKAFTGVRVPEGLVDVTFSNLEVYVVANPLGVTIGAEVFPFGFAFKGAIDFYGFKANASAKIDYHSGISAQCAMPKIALGGVLLISDGTGGQGPRFLLQTLESPYASGSMHVSLFELSQTLDFEVSNTGFAFSLEGNAGAVHYSLSCSLVDYTRFKANGTAVFAIKTGAITISAPGSGIKLGELALNTRLNGVVEIELGTKAFELALHGGFTWGGKDFSMPTLKLHAELKKLADVAGLAAEWIEKKAWEVFGKMASDANQIAALARDGFVELEEDFDQLLKTYYKLDATAAAEVCKTLGYATDETIDVLNEVFGATSSETSKALQKAYGVSASAADSAVKGAKDAANNVKKGANKASKKAKKAGKKLKKKLGF